LIDFLLSIIILWLFERKEYFDLIRFIKIS
ncbi:hypothetical protein SNEBB_007444, partial [Seison nebaliae]